MKVFECLDAINARGQHYQLEIDDHQHSVAEFAANGSLTILQSPAELHWNDHPHPHNGDEVGAIYYEPHHKSGEVVPHKHKIIIRYHVAHHHQP